MRGQLHADPGRRLQRRRLVAYLRDRRGRPGRRRRRGPGFGQRRPTEHALLGRP
ncbi:MAG TPA: hypothetical protein VL334_15455 [Anaerolineae bacterium]|nr:hypothetical protein [Anaerolineae bacterium]